MVEPSPSGCPVYEEYAGLWRRAMHSIGGFEDYMPVEYWRRLLEETGFTVLQAKRVEWRACIPYEVFRGIVEDTAAAWARLGVPGEYIRGLWSLLDRARREGIKWSDIYVILAEDRNSHG